MLQIALQHPRLRLYAMILRAEEFAGADVDVARLKGGYSASLEVIGGAGGGFRGQFVDFSGLFGVSERGLLLPFGVII